MARIFYCESKLGECFGLGVFNIAQQRSAHCTEYGYHAFLLPFSSRGFPNDGFIILVSLASRCNPPA